MLNEEQYILEISSQLDLFKKVDDRQYNCRCFICGDSSKSKFKKRGWFILNKDHTWSYHCFNCSVSLSLKSVLKSYFPVVYNRYIYELLSNKSSSLSYKRAVTIEDDVTEIVSKNLIPLEKSKIVSKYIDDRKIPHARRSEIFIIKDFSVLKEIPKYKESNLIPEPRIAIPVYNKDGRIVYLISRGLLKNSSRYINLSFDDSMNFFGLYRHDGGYRIDLNQKVYVTEGAFDSMFLDNAIAVNNADLLRVVKFFGKLSKSIDFIFVPDADKRNSQVLSVYSNIIKHGHKIAILPSEIKGKDLNEIVLNNPNINIKELIEFNVYSGLEAELVFKKWKRL